MIKSLSIYLFIVFGYYLSCFQTVFMSKNYLFCCGGGGNFNPKFKSNFNKIVAQSDVV